MNSTRLTLPTADLRPQPLRPTTLPSPPPGVSLQFGTLKQWPTVAPQVWQTLAGFPPNAAPPLNPTFHQERREALLAQLPEKTAVVLVGGKELRRNNDVHFPFRQQTNFYYLTGFEEPNAVAILQNTPGQPRLTMFVPPKDPAAETWTGRRAGPEGARNLYGADAAFPIDELEAKLPGLLQGAENLELLAAESTIPDSKSKRPMSHTSLDIFRLLKQLQPNPTIGDAAPRVDELRVIKTPHEIALLKRACQITAKAHTKAMKAQGQAARKNPTAAVNEGEIQARVESHFRKRGALRAGYPSIAGAGVNACILHYTTNNDPATPGDLILVDAGAEYGYYTGDITRTWPISGTFTPEQKALYNLVLKAEEAGIQAVQPGATLSSIHQQVVRILSEGLVDLGLLPGPVEARIQDKTYTRYFMHGTSHFLGMDVHDTSGANLSREDGKQRPLEPGMVLTIEPGLYIDPAVAQEYQVDPKWWGLGIRIEDNVLVTPTGRENLTRKAPKTVEAIERLMQKG